MMAYTKKQVQQEILWRLYFLESLLEEVIYVHITLKNLNSQDCSHNLQYML